MNQLANQIGFVFGVLALGLIGILLLYIFTSFSGKKRPDNNYILYMEITRQAILELMIRGEDYRGPSKLYRMNFPWVGDLNAVAAECLKTCKEIDALEEKLAKEEKNAK